MNLYISSCVFLIFLLLYIPSQILCEDFPSVQIKSVKTIHLNVSSSNPNVEKIQSTQVEPESMSRSNAAPSSSELVISSAQLKDIFTDEHLGEENYDKSDLSHIRSIDSMDTASKENAASLISKKKIAELKTAEDNAFVPNKHQTSNEKNKMVLDNHDISELLIKDTEMNINRNEDQSAEYSHDAVTEKEIRGQNLIAFQNRSNDKNIKTIPGDIEHYFDSLENIKGDIKSNIAYLYSIGNISYISINNDALSDLGIHLNKSVSSMNWDHSEKKDESNTQSHLSELGILISDDKNINKANNKTQEDSTLHITQKERILKFANDTNLPDVEKKIKAEKMDMEDSIQNNLSDVGIYFNDDKRENVGNNKALEDLTLNTRQKEKTQKFTNQAGLTDLGIFIDTNIAAEENERKNNKEEKVDTEAKIKEGPGKVGVHVTTTEVTIESGGTSKENQNKNNLKKFYAGENTESNLKKLKQQKTLKFWNQTDLSHFIDVNTNKNAGEKERANKKDEKTETEAKIKDRLRNVSDHVTNTEVTIDFSDTSTENQNKISSKSLYGENTESNQKILNRQKTPKFSKHADLTDLGIFIDVNPNMTAEKKEREDKKLLKINMEAKLIEILGDVGFHMTTTEVTLDLNDRSKGNQIQNKVEKLKNVHTNKTTESILVAKKMVMDKNMDEDNKNHEYSDLPLEKDTKTKIGEHEKHEKNIPEAEIAEKNNKQDAEKNQIDKNVLEFDIDLSNKMISSSYDSFAPENTATHPEKQQSITEKLQPITEKPQPITEKQQPITEKQQPITETQKSTTEKQGEKLKTTVKPRAKFSQTFINELFKDQEEQNRLDSKIHVNFIDYVVSQMIDYSINGTYLYLGGFDDVYKFKLQPLRSENFLKKAFLWTETPKIIKSKHLSSKLKDLDMYEGIIEQQEELSFAVGYIVNDTFMGAIMLPSGKTVYIELVQNYQHADSMNHKKYFTYTGSHVLLSSCARLESSGDICSEELYSDLYSCKSQDYSQVACFVGYENRHSKHHFWNENFKFGNASFAFNHSHVQPTQSTTCLMELVSESSHPDSKPNMTENIILRELIIIGLHAKWIFKQLDFNNDGLPDNFNLQIGRIVVKISNPSQRMNETMKHHLSKFQQHRHSMCAAVLFVSTSLKREPISTTYAGGICKNKNDKGELATNVAVINDRNPNGDTNVLFIRAMTLVRTIGQMMGSFQDCDEKMSSTALPHYWNSFFSECEINNMARFVESDGSCSINENGHIYKKLQPRFQIKGLCGNQRIDPGEECDCGSPENCITENSCCIPPGNKNECRFDRSKGHECEWKDLCCTRSCKFIPKSWKFLCSVGEPSCSTETSYCNGISSKCPSNGTVASTYDGLGCWPGPPKSDGSATCKNGFCNSTVCQDNGLLDCMCTPKSGEECRVCCKKEENKMCVPIEHFGVRSKGTKLFFRRPGTVCQEVKFGHCNRRGFCTSKIKRLNSAASHIYAPIVGHRGYFITYITVAFSILSRLLFFKLF